MTTTIIILAYIGNVFLNRWLNKIAYEKFDFERVPLIWFFSLYVTIIFLCFIISHYLENTNNWFTGKHWKR